MGDTLKCGPWSASELGMMALPGAWALFGPMGGLVRTVEECDQLIELAKKVRAEMEAARSKPR